MFISVALAAAIALAVGHHYRCLSLAGEPVDDISVSQAWVFRFSAAPAFLVKTALTIGVGTAYVQQRIRRNDTGADPLPDRLGKAEIQFHHRG